MTGEGLTIAEAAAKLRLTPEAVRKRVQRGQIPARKVGGQWRVVLPDVLSLDSEQDKQDKPAGQDAETPGPQDNMAGQTGPATGQQDNTTGQTGQRADSERDELLDALRSEVEWLREELRRRDMLLATALQRIPELPAPRGEPTDTASPTSPTEEGAADHSARNRRPWWRLWRK